EDTILQKTPYFFDVSVWEMFWWSIVGARVCFLMPNDEKFPQAIIETSEQNKVTVMHFVPSMLSVFLAYLANSEDDVRKMAPLKQVFASGEKLTVSHVEAFNAILHKKNTTRMANLYGPTEATVDVSYYDCPTEGKIDKIPIGKAIDNIELPVLGEDGKMLPLGETGELCIGGVGLARGYLNNPGMTA
ncbi:MAG: amino acid adenylation domain-containing protein, partial [bacterium]|nr:amino acid adenylation domain-containing protein [bacterium]